MKTLNIPLDILENESNEFISAWLAGAKYTLNHMETLDLKVEPNQLTLSKEELQFLAEIMAMIGGCPDTTDRKYQKTIGNKLKGLGFYFTDGYHTTHCDGYGINFKDVD